MHKEFKAETKLGPIFITPTEANHLHVCSSAHGEHRSRLTLRGCDYYISGHFYQYKDATFNIGPEDKNTYERRQALYLSRENNVDVSESAYNKLAEVLTEAVTKWVSENTDKLYDAETEHIKDKLDTRIADLNNAEKLVATIKADVKKLKTELEQHKRLVHQPVEYKDILRKHA